MAFISTTGVGAKLCDVAVIGRGPIGAAAALALNQAELRVAWVGRESLGVSMGSDWDARVYALSGSARQLLTLLKVWDALAHDRIAPVYDMRVFPSAMVTSHAAAASDPAAAAAAATVAAARAARSDELHFGAYEARTEALAWIVEGRNLGSTLNRAIGFSSVEPINANLVALDRRDPHRIVLNLDDGTQLHAKLVIAADGADSITRDQAGIASVSSEYPHTAVVANFECAAVHADCAWQWFGSHGVLALLPLPGRHCSMVWSAPHALAHELMAASAEQLSARVSELSNYALGALHAISPARSFALRRIRVERTVQTRIALVGDSAHVIHPLAGQGMNLGFADVAALAQVLAGRESFRDIGDQLLLRRYERQRKEPVLAVSTAIDALQKLFDPDAALNTGPIGKPLQALRDLGWSVVARSEWIKRQLIELAAA